MTQFTKYRRSQIAELRPYQPGEPIKGISISAPDKDAGSPKPGDMIARNPKNHADQWLVAAKYFADNFEALEAAAAQQSQESNCAVPDCPLHAAQPSREAALVKALEEIAADEKIYKGHGNYDEGPLPGNLSQEIARKALAAYDTPAKDERREETTPERNEMERG